MLWPHCLHGWIWYFSHSCRQYWRSWGMCDHRALWPPRLHAFLSCLGPKTWAIAPLSVYSRSELCDKPQQTATHSEQKMTTLGTTAALSNDQWKRSIFPFWCTSDRAVIASALRVGECAAENMSCTCQSRAARKPAPPSPGLLKAGPLLPSSGLVPKNASQGQLIRLCINLTYFSFFFSYV